MLSIPILDGLTNLVGKVLDKVIPDAAQRDAIKAQLAQELQSNDFELDKLLIENVNKTMQAEAASEHWAQWLWRPVVGFTFSAVIINNFIVMPYFPSVHAINLPAEMWTAMLVILGAAAATRGWEKVTKVQAAKR